MKITGSRHKQHDVEMDLSLAQARLDQLERNEWWRWSVAFIVILALTCGLFVLSMPIIGGRGWTEQSELNVGVRGVLALVLLFDIFVVYQQALISRLRRDLATQLRLVTTLEVLKKNEDDTNLPIRERRHVRRLAIDRRVRVITSQDGKSTCVHGRIRDISEDGMGAVIPCSMSVDERVTLEFSLEGGEEGKAIALVRHQQGFYYGFDFMSIDPQLRQAISQTIEKVESPVA